MSFLAMFRSALFRRLLISMQLIVLSFALASYFLIAPIVRDTVLSLEESAADTILNNVDAIVRTESLSVEDYWKSAITSHKRQLKSLVNAQQKLMLSLVAHYQGLALSEQEIRRKLKQDISESDSNAHKLIWMLDADMRVVTHSEKSFIGEASLAITDVYDNKIYAPMHKELGRNDSGYFTYWISGGDTSEQTHRLTYFQRFPLWNWIVGLDVNIDEIETEVSQREGNIVAELREIMNSISHNQMGMVFLFDSDLNIVIHPDKGQEGGKIDSVFDSQSGELLGERFIAVAETGGMVEYYRGSKGETGSIGPKNLARVRFFKGFDWYLVFSVGVDELNTSVDKLRSQIFWITIALFLLLNIVAILFLQRILGPINQLSSLALKAKNGDLTVSCNVGERKDELGILAQSFNSMIAKINSRTKDLQIAKDDAEKANSSKTRFVAATSHDLSQPLHAARLFASALVSKIADKKQEEMVHNIQRSLGSAEAMLQEILDISKLESGSIAPTVRAVKVSDIFIELGVQIAALAEERGIELKIVPSSVVVTTDRGMLRRIIQNFLTNAMRYTRDGKVLLGCRRDGDELRIEVWDTGPGIAEDKQKKIFEEFLRLENHDPYGERCFGLGLAIVDRMAKILQHGVTLRTWEGKGSVFAVSVPISKETRKVIEQRSVQREGFGDISGLNFLCIDNERDALNGIDALLQSWGCSASLVQTLDQTLEAIKNKAHKPDLIIADYQLDNEQDGLMVIDQVRTHYGCNIPSIILTANASQELKSIVQEHDCFFLTKPVKPAALRALIARLVG